MKPFARKAIPGLLAVLAAGCNLLEPPVPEEARVVLEGPAGESVRVITSTRFVAGTTTEGTTRIVVINADTADITLPFESRHRIRADQRFMVQTEPIEGETESFRMQVYIDAAKEYDETGTLGPATLFRFVYTFNLGMTDRIEVVF